MAYEKKMGKYKVTPDALNPDGEATFLYTVLLEEEGKVTVNTFIPIYASAETEEAAVKNLATYYENLLLRDQQKAQEGK